MKEIAEALAKHILLMVSMLVWFGFLHGPQEPHRSSTLISFPLLQQNILTEKQPRGERESTCLTTAGGSP